MSVCSNDPAPAIKWQCLVTIDWPKGPTTLAIRQFCTENSQGPAVIFNSARVVAILSTLLYNDGLPFVPIEYVLSYAELNALFSIYSPVSSPKCHV